ncbi:MAG: hypothetical protein D6781_12490 [Verrucomicrobia bacterium]|nr:MAG: hypothetical protein D6781_12490 [Verrucomicrobiota bacterium]
MARMISPLRFAWEGLLGLVGLGPRHARFSTIRDPESRVRFAQYLRRVQPSADAESIRRAAAFLGSGGSVSRGNVRHAPAGGEIPARAVPHFTFSGQPTGIISRRRQLAHRTGIRETSSRSLLNALRIR